MSENPIRKKILKKEEKREKEIKQVQQLKIEVFKMLDNDPYKFFFHGC